MLLCFFYTTIATTFISVYLYYAIRSLSDNVHIHGRTPPVVLIFFRLAWKILCREQGQVYNCDGTKQACDVSSLDGSQDCKPVSPCKDETVTICNYRIKEKDLKKYKEVCGEKDDDTATVPLCYPECLFIRSLLLLVCKPQFRLSPLGLIHVGQTITQHEDLGPLVEGPISLETRTKEYRVMSKGVEVDIEMRVISASDRCVWSGVATLLSRSQHVQRSGSQPSTTRLMSMDSEWEKHGKCQRYTHSMLEPPVGHENSMAHRAACHGSMNSTQSSQHLSKFPCPRMTQKYQIHGSHLGYHPIEKR